MSSVQSAGPHFLVSVVIPFFQREPGPLRRALDSICAQSLNEPIEVLVIDDASPVPAAELAHGVTLPERVQLRVVRQENGGPASARNRGLRERSRSSRFVAFLDSDDTWSAKHLERGVAALSAGASFYFADHFQLEQRVSAFDRTKRIDVARHKKIPTLDGAYFFDGDMREQIMLGNLIGTSTVMFDAHHHPDVMFREEFYSAGEDYLCWMDFAAEGARFAFSMEPEATYGRGVNVYSGATWGTDAHLVRIQNELRFLRTADRVHRLSDPVRRHIAERQRSLRGDFVGSLIQRIRSAQDVPWGIVWNHVKADPSAIVSGGGAYLRLKLRRKR